MLDNFILTCVTESMTQKIFLLGDNYVPVTGTCSRKPMNNLRSQFWSSSRC